jgi:hypothetical protein
METRTINAVERNNRVTFADLFDDLLMQAQVPAFISFIHFQGYLFAKRARDIQFFQYSNMFSGAQFVFIISEDYL